MEKKIPLYENIFQNEDEELRKKQFNFIWLQIISLHIKGNS